MQSGARSASPCGPRGSSCLLARTIPVPSADRLRPRFLVGVRNTPAHVYQTWHTPQTPKCLSLPFYRRKLRLSEEQSLSQENGREDSSLGPSSLWAPERALLKAPPPRFRRRCPLGWGTTRRENGFPSQGGNIFFSRTTNVGSSLESFITPFGAIRMCLR